MKDSDLVELWRFVIVWRSNDDGHYGFTTFYNHIDVVLAVDRTDAIDRFIKSHSDGDNDRCSIVLCEPEYEAMRNMFERDKTVQKIKDTVNDAAGKIDSATKRLAGYNLSLLFIIAGMLGALAFVFADHFFG